MVSQTALKAFLLIINVIFFICGAVVMGIGIWALADKMFISEVVGTSLFRSAAILMTFVGTCLLLLSFLGCGGAILNNKILTGIFVFALVIIFILLLTTAIIAAVFHGDIEDEMKQRMERGLTQQYGYSISYNEENADLTEAWDIMQSKFRCCAVDDSGWYIYKQSFWISQNGNMGYNQVFVPASCCVYEERLRQYINLQQCQQNQLGPPRYNSGTTNNALYYQGCYQVAKRYLKEQANIILGIGFSFLVFLCVGIVLGVMFIFAVKSGRGDFRGQ